ncbi:MAG: hydantoinase B/oxoprolinase family protein, partial [Gammaproteobacteria bacterium]|nr:hydantoinase B/oxoprolinase family protein [Gammaproteobacteria bacterium]
RNTPVEINEAIAPIVIWRKEYRTDSGGAGRYRGGTGQIMEISNREGAPFAISSMFDRVKHPARGREGGRAGQVGRMYTSGGQVLRAKGRQPIAAGERLIMEMPGGGGFGTPWERSVEAVQADVRHGLVSPESARRDYAVVIDASGVVDQAATVALRSKQSRSTPD